MLPRNTRIICQNLTTEDAGSEGAAGDPQVVGVLLCVELVHVQVPQTQVSIRGAGHEHLTAGAEGAGHHCCVIHRSGPSQRQKDSSCINTHSTL